MGAHSVRGGTAPVVTECHPGRPWQIEITFNLKWSSVMKKITARYNLGTAFLLLFMQNGIFAGTLTAGAIGDEPYCEDFKPSCECTKAFFQIRTHIACFQITYIHWVTEPAPLHENRNISFFFYWKLVLFGHNNPQHDILGIHDYP